MGRTSLRILAIVAALGAVVATASRPAEAHSRSRFFFGFNFGAPYSYWGPRYYYPPAYYYPPPAVYVPPPVYYTPPPRPAPYCRDFRGDATVDANGTPFYGRACLEADGRWHIVSSY